MVVIFDCDGVLVDSELIASRELAAYLTELGRPTTAEECREAFTGLSIKAVGEKVRTDWELTLPDNFVAQLRARDAIAFERDLKPIPGVEDVLSALDRAGVLYGVASSGTPEKIRHSLEITHLIERFGEHLYSASHVAHGKPAPDLFLYAARSMGVEANDCIVIEDSPAGVQGAKAAGMRVFGFTGGSHCGAGYADKLSEADAVLSHLRDLPPALGL